VTPDERVYVLVRKDLPLQHQLVQAAHAGIQAAHAFPTDNPSPNLVVLEVDDGSALARAVNQAREADVPITVFFETDDEMGFTAAATAPLERARSKVFRDYRLWRT
jgi:hypothetical protein